MYRPYRLVEPVLAQMYQKFDFAELNELYQGVQCVSLVSLYVPLIKSGQLDCQT
jgi:hypothetical protein